MDKVYLTGENLNIMSKTIGPAMKEGNPDPIRKMAEAQTEAGVDYIDINLGPARKGGNEMMEFVVKTVQEVTSTPLFLDTTNAEAIEAGLKVYQRKSEAKPVINSISCRPERIELLMPMAKKYDAACVGLLMGVEGIPRDENERGMLASEFMIKAAEYGIEPDDIFMDPIVVPAPSQQIQVAGCTNFMMMFRDIAPGCRGTCGLSNISNGAPDHLRGIIDRTYMTIINSFGMSGAIMNYTDKKLMDLMRGRNQDVYDYILKVFNGEETEPPADKEKLDYYKTVKLLLGETLYSASWLDL